MWPPWPLRLGLHLCAPGQAVVPLGLVTTRRQAIAIVGSYHHKTSQNITNQQHIAMYSDDNDKMYIKQTKNIV